MLYEQTRRFPSEWWLTWPNLCAISNYSLSLLYSTKIGPQCGHVWLTCFSNLYTSSFIDLWEYSLQQRMPPHPATGDRPTRSVYRIPFSKIVNPHQLEYRQFVYSSFFVTKKIVKSFQTILLLYLGFELLVKHLSVYILAARVYAWGAI